MKNKTIYLTLVLLLLMSTLTYANASTPLLDFSAIKILVNGEQFIPQNDIGEDIGILSVNGETYLPVQQLLEFINATVKYDRANDTLSITMSEGINNSPSGSQFTKDIGNSYSSDVTIYTGTPMTILGRHYQNAITTTSPEKGIYLTNYGFKLSQQYKTISGELFCESNSEPLLIKVCGEELDYGFIKASPGTPTKFNINIEGEKERIGFYVMSEHKDFVIGDIVLSE